MVWSSSAAYASEPAITSTSPAFLLRISKQRRRHSSRRPDPSTPILPDVVLYNGGVGFRSATAQDASVRSAGGFRGSPLRELENLEPELSVARGAVALRLGSAWRGRAHRRWPPAQLTTCSSRPKTPTKKASACCRAAPKKGEDLVLRSREFFAARGQARGAFPSVDQQRSSAHTASASWSSSTTGYQELPAIAAVLEAQAGDPVELRVELQHRPDRGRHARDELRGHCGPDAPLQARVSSCADTAAAATVRSPSASRKLHPRFEEATALVH